MAGDWIKIEDCLPDKPEVIGIAATLGIDQDAVIGKLIRLWIWADQQTINGDAVSVTRSSLDRIAFAPGFADAMFNVGWLVGKDGQLTFPNFDRHNGETAKKRALTAKRMAKQRSRKSDAASVTVASSREEKRREEKGGVPPLTPLAAKTPSDPPASLGRKSPDPDPGASIKPPRPRDLLFDAIADVTGSDPKVSGGHIGKVAASLKKADPAYTPDEVREWAVKIRELWGLQPTLGMIEKHIGKIRSSDPLAWAKPGKAGVNVQQPARPSMRYDAARDGHA